MDATGLTDEVERLVERKTRPVIGIGVGDGGAVLVEFRPDRSELGEIAPHDLPAIVEGAVGLGQLGTVTGVAWRW
jgi:hypothetical protein